jgi:hypothetical protein
VPGGKGWIFAAAGAVRAQVSANAKRLVLSMAAVPLSDSPHYGAGVPISMPEMMQDSAPVRQP